MSFLMSGEDTRRQRTSGFADSLPGLGRAATLISGIPSYVRQLIDTSAVGGVQGRIR